MKKRKTISITLPIQAENILNSMAERRNISRSKLIELTMRGTITIEPIEWQQWEQYYTYKEEKK